ncbi:hypothetical protein B0H17DRAFT_671638 [Mycena rosella]|uniref:Uncharacterized protein n=1 Tax=Mycena rosella TaxID=1033263 RepID=A0AAD7GUR0_MYCRO|nr:hypothetical protein B0H17DRAFT_671638 [Mycena rosella]
MTRRLRFTKLDVFTSTPFVGNPLAIVHVPPTVQLSQAEKQLVAREFNLSETVFLHEPDGAAAAPPAATVIDIFTPTEELPFAGHPTIGAGFHLLSRAPHLETATLRTKAGDIPVVRGAGPASATAVRLRVPIDFKVHPSLAIPAVKDLQPHLAAGDYVNGAGAEACASIVKGMTFLLLALASEDALARLQPYPTRLAIPDARAVLGAWGVGFAGLYAFVERADGGVRARMLDGPLEDPATGSAASTLGGWLAQRRGPGVHRIEIVQGVEMGRRSEIGVRVDVGEDGVVREIELEGAAVQVMEGVVDV